MLYALPVSSLAASKLAAADAAQEIFGGYSGRIITAVALTSLIGIVNAGMPFTGKSPAIKLALNGREVVWLR